MAMNRPDGGQQRHFRYRRDYPVGPDGAPLPVVLSGTHHHHDKRVFNDVTHNHNTQTDYHHHHKHKHIRHRHVHTDINDFSRARIYHRHEHKDTVTHTHTHTDTHVHHHRDQIVVINQFYNYPYGVEKDAADDGHDGRGEGRGGPPWQRCVRPRGVEPGAGIYGPDGFVPDACFAQRVVYVASQHGESEDEVDEEPGHDDEAADGPDDEADDETSTPSDDSARTMILPGAMRQHTRDIWPPVRLRLRRSLQCDPVDLDLAAAGLSSDSSDEDV